MKKIYTLFFLSYAMVAFGQDVTTFAGSSIPGFTDGIFYEARFDNVEQTAVDSEGNVFVADSENNAIRKISVDGQVTTFAGNGSLGDLDGNGTDATFDFPLGLAIDPDDNLYIGDNHNHKIRKITPEGQVTTYAGTGDEVSTDGPALEASFDNPVYLCVDHLGNVYVTESASHKIRKIDVNTGMVLTVAGTVNPGFTNGAGASATFNLPRGITIDPDLNIYVADQGNNAIRKIAADGTVSTYAGDITAGHVDANGLDARFNGLKGLAIDKHGSIFVADRLNYCVRKIDKSLKVTTVAGVPGISGYQDGDHGIALIGRAVDVSLLTTECLLVSDWENDCIRKVLLTEAVPTREITSTIDFQIFPNPANEYLQLNGEFGQTFQIQIFNISGKLLLQKANEKNINIAVLPIGEYVVRIVGNDYFGTEKFTKISY